MKRPLAWTVGFALLLAPAAALAHHSFAMFDQTRIVTLNGTVKEFQWTNPHSVIWVLVPAADAQADLWTVELGTSPGNLTRMGWSKHSVNPGDKVAIDVNPLRDGRHGGSLKKVVLVDSGKVLSVGTVGQPPAKP